jgi:ATP-binding cassette subfamily F protein uup
VLTPATILGKFEWFAHDDYHASPGGFLHRRLFIYTAYVMALLFSCDSLSKSFGPRPLFTNITLHLEDNQRTGLIGPNGSGKSTLLKILAGLETADSGALTTKRQLRLGYLPQNDVFTPGLTVEQVMLAAISQSAGDEHEHHTRVAITLSKIGFTDFEQSVDILSGGWRKRLALARELIKEPDLLLLDEPTNHLDVEGILWLERLLREAPFAFLLVSHDRYFLENTTNRIIELNTSYANGFLSINGTYGDFLQKRAEYLEAQASFERSLAGRVRREIEWLQRGAKARRTKAKGRIEDANRMIDDLADVKARNAKRTAASIEFAGTQRQTRKLLAVKHVSKSLGDRLLFNNVNFILAPGTRLGLLGPNGSGKTSLIRLLTNDLTPDSGEIVRADVLKIVTFDQNREQLEKDQLLRRALSPGGDNIVYRGEAMHISGWARRFNFRTDQLDMRVGDLSGGEQARILIARLMMQPADLLILDEPTNDLDIPTLEVLEESLEEFPGALVLVTHDRFMLDRISTELLAIDGAGNSRMHVDLAEWERTRTAELKPAEAVKKTAAKSVSKPPPGLRRLSYMEQREWEQIEEKIMLAETELESRQNLLDDPEVARDHVKLTQTCRDLESAQEQVKKLYSRWEELESKQK